MPWILPDPDEEPNMKNSEKIDERKVFCDLKNLLLCHGY